MLSSTNNLALGGEEGDDEERDVFAQMRENSVVRKQMTFTLESSDTLLQMDKMTKSGIYRIRVSLTQKLELLWQQ